MDKCDQEVYDKGTVVFITNTIRTPRMEEWVQKIAADSGQRVDWHQYAGRPVMKALGDLDRVRKAIIKNREMHDDYYVEAVKEYRHQEPEWIAEIIRGIWEYNYREHELGAYLCSKCSGRCLPQNHAGWDPTQEGHG